MSFKKVIMLLVASFSLLASAEELIYQGQVPEIDTEKNINQVREKFLSRNREEISYILQVESSVKTVQEAIDLKTRGLMYVQDISDFEYLTSCPFNNPSDAYKKSVGDFIASNVAKYVYSLYDLQILNILESRVSIVQQAIAIKSAAFNLRLQIQDFVRLIAPAINNPSDAYKTAISNFTAQNIRRVVDRYSPIYLILEAEKNVTTVSDAMAVKNAGLIAVRTERDLFELATYSVPNPSATYQQAVNDFLRNNIGKYPRALSHF